MRRREFMDLLGGGMTWPYAAQVQEPKKSQRLCFRTFDPGTLETNRFKPFFEGLRDFGYVAGQTLAIDYISADGRGDRFLPSPPNACDLTLTLSS